MNFQIIYLMSGPAHCPYLLVSLMTLRQHYNGPVTVYAWPESYPIVEMIAKDESLNVLAVQDEPEYRGKNSQFLRKTQLLQQPKATVQMYLDADTTIHHPDAFHEPCKQAAYYGFCGTQFNNWLSNGRVVRGRVERLIGHAGIDEDAVRHVASHPYPSPNGGVLAARPGSPVLETWEAWTWAARDIFISDEAALHVMQHIFRGQFHMLCDGWWNASHKFWDESRGHPHIYHYHGDSNVRPEKSPKAVKFWMPLWQKCINENLGNCRDWPSLDCGNKYLKALKGDSEYGWTA